MNGVPAPQWRFKLAVWPGVCGACARWYEPGDPIGVHPDHLSRHRACVPVQAVR